MKRQISRIASVEYKKLAYGGVTFEDQKNIDEYCSDLSDLNITYSTSSDISKVVGACSALKPDIVMVDYIQIFNSGDKSKSKMEDSDRVMQELRKICLLYTSPSPRDRQKSRMPSSA